MMMRSAHSLTPGTVLAIKLAVPSLRQDFAVERDLSSLHVDIKHPPINTPGVLWEASHV